MAALLQERPLPSREELEASLQGLLAAETDVVFAYLFGSFAKGRARAASDVDLAVYFASEAVPGDRSMERGFALEARLQQELGRKVQVVDLGKVPLGLAHSVLQHGRLLVDRHPELRAQFYVDHCRRWFDQRAARQIFDRAMRRRIDEGRFGRGAGEAT